MNKKIGVFTTVIILITLVLANTRAFAGGITTSNHSTNGATPYKTVTPKIYNVSVEFDSDNNNYSAITQFSATVKGSYAIFDMSTNAEDSDLYIYDYNMKLVFKDNDDGVFSGFPYLNAGSYYLFFVSDTPGNIQYSVTTPTVVKGETVKLTSNGMCEWWSQELIYSNLVSGVKTINIFTPENNSYDLEIYNAAGDVVTKFTDNYGSKLFQTNLPEGRYEIDLTLLNNGSDPDVFHVAIEDTILMKEGSSYIDSLSTNDEYIYGIFTPTITGMYNIYNTRKDAVVGVLDTVNHVFLDIKNGYSVNVKLTSGVKYVIEYYLNGTAGNATYGVKYLKPAQFTKIATSPQSQYGFSPGGTNRLNIQLQLSTPYSTNLKANIYNGSGKIVAVLTKTGVMSGEFSLPWDGKYTTGNTAGGTAGAFVPVSSTGTSYTIKVTATSVAGTATSQTVSIKLYSKAAISKFTIVPAAFKATSVGTGKARISFVSNRMTNAQVRIINASGKTVAIFNKTNVTPNTIVYVDWTGKATSGNNAGYTVGSLVPKGNYSVQILAGATLYKPTTAITVSR